MPNVLFYGEPLRDVIENHRHLLKAEIEKAPEDHVLQVDVSAWAQALSERWQIEPPTLADEADWHQDPDEAIQFDVRRDYLPRNIVDPSRPALVPGHRVVARVPFTGDPDVFKFRPSSWTTNPPSAAIRGQEVVRTYEFPDDNPAKIADEVRGVAKSLAQYLQFAREDLDPFNAGLEEEARQLIVARKDRVIKYREHTAATGLPTRGDPKGRTYIADVIVRRPVPLPANTPTSVPLPLEPTTGDAVFEDILGIVRAAAVAIERAPKTYEGMDEESLRQIILLPLNASYAGKVTAEAFNVSGKTDLLLKHENNNLFIGECKKWSGQKEFARAIDQLFGYTAWRDGKLSLIVFVAERDLTSIIEKGKTSLRQHDQFVSLKETGHEQELRAKMTWPGDPEREVDLNVFFVHLPAASASAPTRP